jgi:hypothetical protein
LQYLHSIYLPSEDTCFCLFRGVSVDALRDINHEAGFALDRITDALLLFPGSSSSRTSGTSDRPESPPNNAAARQA